MTAQHLASDRSAATPVRAILKNFDLLLPTPSPTKTLWFAIDIGKRKHEAYWAPSDRSLSRRLRFQNTLDGIRQLDEGTQKTQASYQPDETVVGMEPSGIYWKPLFEQLKTRPYRLVLVHATAVKHNRQTLGDNPSKTDRKDAFSIWDLLRQRKYFTPVEKDPEQAAAYRMIRHYED